MKLVEIEPNKFNDLALAEPGESFYQTLNWGDFYSRLGYHPIYVGYKDDSDVYYALALILIKDKESLFSHKTALCPYGFLTNYYDTDLLKNFTKDLKKFLSKKGVGELTINPNVPYVTSRGNNDLLIKNITKLGYKKTKNNILYSNKIEKIEKAKLLEDVYLNSYVVDNAEQASKLFKANPNYENLYNAMGKLVKFIVCEIDTKKSIDELTNKLKDARIYIENHKEEINNPDLDDNKAMISEKKPILDLLNKYINDNPNNSLLAVTCLVEFNNKVTVLFTDNKKEYQVLNAIGLLNQTTLETIKKLGYDCFDSYTETSDSQKIDLIGEFTYSVK